MAVAGSQHQAARAGRTASGRFSGTHLRRHPAPTPGVRPTTANRPQPCPAVMCDRETVDAELRANGTLQMLDAEGAFRLAPEDRPTGFAVTRLAVPCCAPGPRCSWLPQMPELQGHPLHPFRLHEGHA